MISIRLLAIVALLAVLGSSGVVLAVTAADAVCRPAVADASVDEAPAPWRAAVASLLRSTAVPGHPWSCRGGIVSLRMHDAGATLVVTPPGDRPIERELSVADDVVPLGQALLCVPSEAAPPAPPAPLPAALTPTNRPTPTTPTSTTPAPAEPRLLVSALGGARLLLPPRGATLGGDLVAAIPLGAWLPAVRLRWQHQGKRAENLEDVSMGLLLSRRWVWSHLELRAGLSVAAAVLVRDLPPPAGQDVRVDARVGALVGLVLPLTERLRLVGGIDGDLAPTRMPPGGAGKTGNGPTTSTGTDPAFPAMTFGATVGIEVAL